MSHSTARTHARTHARERQALTPCPPARLEQKAAGEEASISLHCMPQTLRPKGATCIAGHGQPPCAFVQRAQSGVLQGVQQMDGKGWRLVSGVLHEVETC
ncbi:hypothetical protein PMIN04_012700 [Paraphaeosphaeria minitans]